MNNNVVCIHEDFYRQIELVPEENYFFTNQYIDSIQEPNGSAFGFLSASDRKDHNLRSVKILNRNISLMEIKNEIEPLSINFFENIKIGYSNSFTTKINCCAWGFERLGIFVEWNSDKLITNIWLALSSEFKKDFTGNKLFDVLSKVGKNHKLVLIDWNEDIIVRLSNAEFTKKYLNDSFGLNTL